MILANLLKVGRKNSMKISQMIRKIKWIKKNLKKLLSIEVIVKTIIGFIG